MNIEIIRFEKFNEDYESCPKFEEMYMAFRVTVF